MAGLDISREEGGRESGAKGHLITADLAESVIAAGQFSASPCGSDYANRYQPVSVHRRLSGTRQVHVLFTWNRATTETYGARGRSPVGLMASTEL